MKRYANCSECGRSIDRYELSTWVFADDGLGRCPRPVKCVEHVKKEIK